MTERLQQYRVPLLTALGAVVVAIVVYLAWISPEGSKLATLRSQQTKLQAQQASLQAEIATLKREKANLGPTCATLTKDVTAIPGAPDVDSFLQQVTALAVSSGDPNTPSISVTQAAGGTGTSAGVTPVAVTFTLGGTYGQMSTFLQGLYSFPRFFTITSLTVGGGPVAIGGAPPVAATPAYTLSLNGNIYYSSGQQNACAAST
ncbi:MAG TPA: type 4a pilus biogenesis protein PilO [Acidimicrobiales bacterium]|nr:type 4a pilus biogenesis protein PilO [Acidimicrobiales bacterium]